MISTSIEEAISQLKQGNLVAIPTETVYGLAANALDEKAVASIFAAKNRPHFDPLIVHCSSLEEVKKYSTEFPAPLLKLAQHFWPGPLTLLLPKQPFISDLVTAGSSRCAFRVPNHPLTLEVLKSLPFPLAAPSANPFGYVSPTTAEHVENQLGEAISMVLDGGPCSVGLESTIVGWENGLVIYRLGGCTTEEIEKIAGVKISRVQTSSSQPAAPGMLDSHYAPKKKVVMVEDWNTTHCDCNQGFLFFGDQPFEAYHFRNLSEGGNAVEAAAQLFKFLRELDELPIEMIYTQLLPEAGLGRAINDRLKRASA
jgi:L-threonylcarbamoyladenylate synthase